MSKINVLLFAVPYSGYYPPFYDLYNAELITLPYDDKSTKEGLYSLVLSSDVLICDVSKPSLNLMCGLAYASELNKPVILMSDDSVSLSLDYVQLPKNWIGRLSYSSRITGGMSEVDMEHKDNQASLHQILSRNKIWRQKAAKTFIGLENRHRRKNLEEIQFSNRNFWFRQIGVQELHWVLIETENTPRGVPTIYFITSGSEVFDKIEVLDVEIAEWMLTMNRFVRYRSSEQFKLVVPRPPFCLSSHPDGPIYSAGVYWNYHV